MASVLVSWDQFCRGGDKLHCSSLIEGLSLNNIIHPVQESWHAKTCCSMLCFVLLCVYMLLLCIYFYQVFFCILDNWGRAWTHASLSIVSLAIGHNGWDAQRVTLALTEFATLLLRSLTNRDVFMRNTYVAWSSVLSGTYNYIKHICIWIWQDYIILCIVQSQEAWM